MESLPTRLALSVLVAALVPLVASCRSQTIDRNADLEIGQIEADVSVATVTPSCHDGSKLRPGCGLVARVMGTDEFRENFRQAHCQGRTDEDCQGRYGRMFDATLRQRYYAADFGAVTVECDARPGSCDDPASYEMMLLDSHNTEVRQRGAERIVDAQERRREAQEQHKAEQWKTVGEVAYLLDDGPKCRSYPSVISGVTNTVCTEGTQKHHRR